MNQPSNAHDPQPVLMFMCDAKFTGETVVRYSTPPEVGSVHRCIVFVRESECERLAEFLKQLGWESLSTASRPFDPQSLNEPSMEPFRRHYDACLKDGHSLAWYS
jgi:hypothetical protein